MIILDVPNAPWRQLGYKYQCSFRGVQFHMEQAARGGGRRVALHQYPKRDIPYAEDMGRTANAFTVVGYLIGPNYLDDKDALIDALEQDGPGILVLQLEYKLTDMQVMVQTYSVTETREKGGMCAVEMSFVEYGDPNYRPTISATDQIEQSAGAVEQAVAVPFLSATQQELAPYMSAFTAGAAQ